MSLPTIEAATEFLTGLGDTEDEVAASVREHGVREKLSYRQLVDESTSVTRNCVIALLLRQEFPELDDTSEYWQVGGYWIHLGRTETRMPGAVTAFIVQVDNDRYNRVYHPDRPIKYPDLIAPQPDEQQPAE